MASFKLFSISKSKSKEILPELLSTSARFFGIPISKSVFDVMLRDKENVFDYLLDVFGKVRENGKTPVLVVDEMQKIGDIKINEDFIYELFNFFVALTKELHLCHVFVVTSDSLFIERVYSEAMLQGRCRYLLVERYFFIHRFGVDANM
jgi:AAA+ ATPase superfamily predicted ATPase